MVMKTRYKNRDHELFFLTYGAEAWAIKTADEQHLREFERKIMLRIYDPVFIGVEWKM